MKKIKSIISIIMALAIAISVLAIPSAAASKMTSAEATAEYKSMVKKLVNSVIDEDYDSFAKLLDSSYTKKEKKALYNSMSTGMKNVKSQPTLSVKVLTRSSTRIYGSYMVYKNTLVAGKPKNAYYVASQDLQGIIKYKSGWKFSKSDKLNTLAEKAYKNSMKKYDLESVNGFFTTDYELITKKVLTNLECDIRVVSVNVNKDDTVTMKLAFLNGSGYNVSNINFTGTFNDANGNVIGSAKNLQLTGILKSKGMETLDFTFKPETAIDKLNLSSVKSNTTFTYLKTK